MFWIPTGGVLLRDIAYTLFFENGTPHMVYELVCVASLLLEHNRSVRRSIFSSLSLSLSLSLLFMCATANIDLFQLLDSARVSKYTGKKCELNRGVGAHFSCLDNTVQGTILELVTDAKIVQDWRGSDWPEHHFSKLTIILRRVPLGTELSFSQV